MKEEMLYKNLQRIQNSSIVGVDVGSGVKILEKIIDDVRKEVIDRAIKMIPGSTNTAKYLGLDTDDINGLTGLAGLLVHNKSASYRKSIKYLGLYKAKDRDAWKIKKYSSKAQRHLTMLTNAILRKNGETSALRYRDLRKILKVVIEARKQMALAGGLGYKPW